jgi:hypothetical protein
MPVSPLPPDDAALYEKYVSDNEKRGIYRVSRRDFIGGLRAGREEAGDLRARQKVFVELQQRSLMLQVENARLKELLTRVQRFSSDLVLDIGEAVEQ